MSCLKGWGGYDGFGFLEFTALQLGLGFFGLYILFPGSSCNLEW